MSKFDNVPISAPKRGTFRLGNIHTTTMDFGRLQVAKIMECVPNDIIKLDMHAFCQAAPNPSPINGAMQMAAHAFFVPTRVICSEWNNYILGLSTPTLPYFTADQIGTALADFAGESTDYLLDAKRHLTAFGLPISYVNESVSSTMADYRISALPFRAFNRVWFDWYRDKQRISDSSMSSYVFDSMGVCSNSEVGILCQPKYRCFPKDYITTAFDAPSEDGSVSAVPISYSSNSYNSNYDYVNLYNQNASTQRGIYGITQKTSVPKAYLSNGVPLDSSTVTPSFESQSINSGTNANSYDVKDAFTGSVNFSVPQLRGAAAYQKWLERLLVSGKSIISRLKAIFNADDTPERLDMSEWIGGTSQEFGFKEHTASASSQNDPQGLSPNFSAFGVYGDNDLISMNGQLSGHGVCDMTLGNITYHAKEHGFLLVVSSIMPIIANYQGLDKMFTRGVATGTCSRFDFFTPDMENVGFQPILMEEVVTPASLSGTISADYDGLSVFGWTQRYMDYKFSHNVVSADFLMPNTSVALQSFHMGRNILRELGYVNAAGEGTDQEDSFASTVTPESLVLCDLSARTAFDDKFTISDASFDHFIVNFKFDIIASRPMQENVMPCIEDKETPIMSVPTGGIRL